MLTYFELEYVFFIGWVVTIHFSVCSNDLAWVGVVVFVSFFALHLRLLLLLDLDPTALSGHHAQGLCIWSWDNRWGSCLFFNAHLDGGGFLRRTIFGDFGVAKFIISRGRYFRCDVQSRLISNGWLLFLSLLFIWWNWHLFRDSNVLFLWLYYPFGLSWNIWCGSQTTKDLLCFFRGTLVACFIFFFFFGTWAHLKLLNRGNFAFFNWLWSDVERCQLLGNTYDLGELFIRFFRLLYNNVGDSIWVINIILDLILWLVSKIYDALICWGLAWDRALWVDPLIFDRLQNLDRVGFLRILLLFIEIFVLCFFLIKLNWVRLIAE